jgi:AraC-like DNA-binding protein
LRGAIAAPIRHVRLLAADALAPWIEHYWIVAWDLDAPFAVETLPHPTVHVTIEARRAVIGGVLSGRFTRVLRGRGRVFGIKFRPAAFGPLWGRPLAQLTDRRVPLRAVFGRAGDAFARRVRAEADDERCAALADQFLDGRLPPLPPDVARVRDLVERMARDLELTRVEQVAALAGEGARTLERRFRAAVGVSPKWVLRRYRLLEAAEQLNASPTPRRLAELAAALGYFDQAHFIRDFKAVVGRTPGEYAAG